LYLYCGWKSSIFSMKIITHKKSENPFENQLILVLNNIIEIGMDIFMRNSNKKVESHKRLEILHLYK